jgi:hypothetical protein
MLFFALLRWTARFFALTLRRLRVRLLFRPPDARPHGLVM